MAGCCSIPTGQIDVVPLGINMSGYERRACRATTSSASATSRASRRKKDCTLLAGAYKRFRDRTKGAKVRLEVAGYLARRAGPSYLDGIRGDLEQAGLADEFTYHGAVDRGGKLAFLRTLDVLSVPAPYDEPKGVFLLEAMAVGVPVVQPRRGAFTEIVEKTGGGLLVRARRSRTRSPRRSTVCGSDRGLRDDAGGARVRRCPTSTTRSRAPPIDCLLRYDAAIARASKRRSPDARSLAASH